MDFTKTFNKVKNSNIADSIYYIICISGNVHKYAQIGHSFIVFIVYITQPSRKQ